jgi:hypothetical protein
MSPHDPPTEIRGWFAGRLTENWFTAPPEITADREEILVVGALADVTVAADASDAEQAAARASRIEAFRDESRAARMRVADDAEHRFGRKVAWGVRIGDAETHFTTLSVPVMTRLRMRDRAVLDTLIDAGVARSRSEALAWCVRLVGEHQGDWIAKLRGALEAVEAVRGEGPAPSR